MSEERTVELKGGHLFDSLNYFSSFKFQVSRQGGLGVHPPTSGAESLGRERDSWFGLLERILIW